MTTETIPVAITTSTGSLVVMQFVVKGFAKDNVVVEREPTDEAIAAEIEKSGIEAQSWRRIDPAEIPTDRAFRNAWTDTGKRIEVDMDKARELQRDRLRRERSPLLAALDVEYQRADEADDADRKRDIAKRKQALRDITKDSRIESAKTPAELTSLTIGDVQ